MKYASNLFSPLFFASLGLTCGVLGTLCWTTSIHHMGILLLALTLITFPARSTAQFNSLIIILLFMIGALTTHGHLSYFEAQQTKWSSFNKRMPVRILNVESCHKNKYLTKALISPGLYINIISSIKPTVKVGQLVDIKRSYLNIQNEDGFRSQKSGTIGIVFCKDLKFTPRQQDSINHMLVWSDHLSKKRNQLSHKCINNLEQQGHDLLNLIFFGNKNNVPYSRLIKYQSDFNTWGVSHYLARSGLHFVILMFLLSFIFIFFNKRLQVFLKVLFCIFFSYATWLSVSYMRALSTLLLLLLTTIVNVRLSYQAAFCIIYMVFLLYNPFLILSLDFQLSFYLTFLLICISLLTAQDKQTKLATSSYK